MRAITLYQPYASLVAAGAKQFETRPRLIHYRGPLLIHAGMERSAMLRVFYSRPSVQKPLDSVPFDELPFGAIVAMCRIEYCTLASLSGVEIGSFERTVGDYGPGRFAWKLADVEALSEPVPCKGLQGLWIPDPSVVEKVRVQISNAKFDTA